MPNQGGKCPARGGGGSTSPLRGGSGGKSPPRGGVQKSPVRGGIPKSPVRCGIPKVSAGNKQGTGSKNFNTTDVLQKDETRAAANSRKQGGIFLLAARKSTLSALSSPATKFNAAFTGTHVELGRGKGGKVNTVAISHPAEAGALSLTQLGEVFTAAGKACHPVGESFDLVVKLAGGDVTLKVAT